MIKLTLYQGDAFQILKSLDEKFNLVILDPPYTQLNDARAEGENWELNMPYNFLFNYLYEHIYDNGIVFLFGIPRYYIHIAEFIRKRFKVWFDLIWVKPQGLNFTKAEIRPLPRHEQILALVKKDVKNVKFTYNYREIGYYDKPYKREQKKRSYALYQKAYHVSTSSINGFRYPTTVVCFENKATMKKEERTPHPTQKPLSLIEWLIKGFSNENDLILDPFLGSGTTMVAARNLRRNCIGIEIKEEYIKLIKKRVNWGGSLGDIEFEFKKME